MTDVVGILLAAGSARRFGAHKLLHPLADGTPVGVAAARNLIQAVPNALAVVRPGDHVLMEAFAALGLNVVENPRADEGMGTSLAAGIVAAAGARGWLIVLADMPWVRSETIHALADGLHNGASIIAPVHAGRRGHPVGFAACWGAQLQAQRGDAGARGLIAEHADQLVLQSTEDAGVLEDIDHPGDLIRQG